MQDDFKAAKNYQLFESLYLEGDKLLDKAPGPRIRGELARKASAVNINNAEQLNLWAREIKKNLINSTGFNRLLHTRLITSLKSYLDIRAVVFRCMDHC